MPYARPKYGNVNWLGLWSLARKETRRFLAVWIQTVVGPIVFALILLTIFAVVVGERGHLAASVRSEEFLAPGLIMMIMMQNAFANTSFSILIAKQSGTMADVLMAPLRPSELTIGYAAGGLARGVLLGMVCGIAMMPFVGLTVVGAGFVLAFGIGGALTFSLLGIVGGILAKKMEHIAFMSQVVVGPLTLLSGTFYSIHQLPEPLLDVIRFNPVFYFIDGFRRGFIDYAESNLVVGAAALAAAAMLAGALCLRMFATGYGLKN